MTTHIKILFLTLTRTDLLSHKRQSLEVENYSLSKHLKLGDFYYIFTIIGKKQLVVEWLYFGYFFTLQGLKISYCFK